jgi:CheY-like chemotaxis protein
MILIVDDHADACEMLKRHLARKGHKADYALSGEEALTALDKLKPDVIVLDEMMPGKTGLEVFRALKSDPRFADLAVIFFSAGYEYAKQQEALRLGAKAWFVKGVSRLDQVIDKISQCAGN